MQPMRPATKIMKLCSRRRRQSENEMAKALTDRLLRSALPRRYLAVDPRPLRPRRRLVFHRLHAIFHPQLSRANLGVESFGCSRSFGDCLGHAAAYPDGGSIGFRF